MQQLNQNKGNYTINGIKKINAKLTRTSSEVKQAKSINLRKNERLGLLEVANCFLFYGKMICLISPLLIEQE